MKLKSDIKCLLTGFYGGGKVLRGGTRYGYTLLRNPPAGVQYFIPEEYKTYESSLTQEFQKQKSVDVDRKNYALFLGKLDREMVAQYDELQRLRLREEDEIDLVHSMNPVLSVNRPYVCSLEFEYVITKRFGGLIKKGFGIAYSKTVMRKILNSDNLRKIVFRSELSFKKAVAHTPSIRHKACVIYRPVELPNLKDVGRREDGTVRLCFVGIDWKLKGLPMLEEVFRKLKGRYDVELTVVTDESYGGTRPEPGIRRLYNLSYDETYPKVYLDSDLFVLPTRFEGVPFSVLEAMACGLPVVTTNVYALPEAVDDGKTGYLIPYGDMKALEGRLSELIENASLRRRMGEAGRRKAEEKFSVDVIKEKFGVVYEESLRR